MLFALPARDNAQYLVLYDDALSAYRVFYAVRDTAPVLSGKLALPAPFPACEPARADLHYFTKGAEVPLANFVALDEDVQPKVVRDGIW